MDSKLKDTAENYEKNLRVNVHETRRGGLWDLWEYDEWLAEQVHDIIK